jgi:hypothetical protein
MAELHRGSVLVPVMAALMSLAGCGYFSPTGPPGSTGTLTGILQAVGGPLGTGPRALSGEVTIIDLNGSRRYSLTVGASGRFSVPAPVGRFSVSGRSPLYEGGAAVCRASGPVVVTKGATSTVEIDCPEMSGLGAARDRSGRRYRMVYSRPRVRRIGTSRSRFGGYSATGNPDFALLEPKRESDPGPPWIPALIARPRVRSMAGRVAG